MLVFVDSYSYLAKAEACNFRQTVDDATLLIKNTDRHFIYYADWQRLYSVTLHIYSINFDNTQYRLYPSVNI